MEIGVPKEIRNHEYRVGATPACVAAYVRDGHAVLVQRGAGVGSGFTDDSYAQAGATLVDSAADVYGQAGMVVKVKEPEGDEIDLLREGQLLYAFLHLAAAPTLAKALCDKRITSIAYETIQLPDRSLPCLTPMSAIAGRLSIQQGAKYLERSFGGRGVLLGGVPGAQRARVTILGGGVVGTHATKMAVGLGAEVTILDISQRRLYELDDLFGARVQTLTSTRDNLLGRLEESDLVVGAVLLPGASAPKLIEREHLGRMLPGALIVDVAIDQGGCTETSRPTTHADPIFEVDGILHYCVTNMPGAVARTATLALTAATLPYGLQLARGLDYALVESRALVRGVNTRDGKVVHKAVARSLDLPAPSRRSSRP